jgi:retron-type reverse transcriptase
MLRFLKRRVRDKKLLKLVWRFLRAGVMEEGTVRNTTIGTPQGGIITLLTKLRTRCESSRPVCHAHRYVPAMAKDSAALRSTLARAVPLHSLWDKETSVVRRERHPPQRRQMQSPFEPSRLRLAWLAQA